jgi:hypothetical protein
VNLRASQSYHSVRAQAREELVVKFALVLVVTASSIGCSPDSGQRSAIAPTPPVTTPVPTPTPGSLASLSGYVVDDQLCVEGATVQVVAGQGVGRSVAQTTPCSIWDYGGGFSFTDLTPGVAMTLRASAPRYTPFEKTVTPHTGGQFAVVINLSKADASPSPPGSLTNLFGFVVDPSGACIAGATVQVIAGQGVGQSVTLPWNCDAWREYEPFLIKDLIPGGAMTLRAFAPGWSPAEKTVVPSGGWTEVILTLSKANSLAEETV